MSGNVTEIRPGAARPNEDTDPPPNSADPESGILIEADHLLATISLLRANIEEKRIQVAEYDIRSGTTVKALWSVEYGIERIVWLMERMADQRRDCTREGRRDQGMNTEPRSTRPIDVVNDISATLDSVAGMLELNIDVIEETEPGNEERMADVIAAMYGIKRLLKAARDRACEARDT